MQAFFCENKNLLLRRISVQLKIIWFFCVNE